MALISALAALGEPRLSTDRSEYAGSRSLLSCLGALPTIGAVLISALSLHSDSWFYYRSPEQTSVRVSAGILLGIALLAAAIAVLLTDGSRSWAAALAVNSMPWLLLFYTAATLGTSTVEPRQDFALLAAVAALATLAGVAAVSLGRRSESRRSQSARNSVASSE
ncbi:hypothetical protein AB0P21_31705 [Kribbella sp. NPDC056861]|uniref:hypothetical protein n=1 Tax=Kribbella sp. NPDC056861 TaxID=3154857 RepID=UPI0034133377